MAGIHFNESQKVNLGWKWIFFIGLYILMLWALLEQYKKQIDIIAILSILFSLFMIIGFNIVVIIMRLDTIINDTEIRFRYKPFHKRPRIINWNNVSKFYLREFKAVREYGGHGIQHKLRKGKSFTVSGNMGLQLILNDGKKILIGTHKPKELEMIIQKLKKQN